LKILLKASHFVSKSPFGNSPLIIYSVFPKSLVYSERKIMTDQPKPTPDTNTPASPTPTAVETKPAGPTPTTPVVK
jgi:hypothetical protein